GGSPNVGGTDGGARTGRGRGPRQARRVWKQILKVSGSQTAPVTIVGHRQQGQRVLVPEPGGARTVQSGPNVRWIEGMGAPARGAGRRGSAARGTTIRSDAISAWTASGSSAARGWGGRIQRSYSRVRQPVRKPPRAGPRIGATSSASSAPSPCSGAWASTSTACGRAAAGGAAEAAGPWRARRSA